MLVQSWWNCQSLFPEQVAGLLAFGCANSVPLLKVAFDANQRSSKVAERPRKDVSFFLCWFSLIGTCCSFSSQQCKWYKSGRVLIRSSWKRITYWGFLLSWPYWLAWKRYQVLLQNYSRLHLPHVRRRLEHRLKDLPGYQMCHPLTPQDLGPRTLGPHPLLV